MKDVESPADPVERLVALFPALAAEFADARIENHHQVIGIVAHRLAALLAVSPEPARKAFCALINSMVAKGGDQENAISTCLLEHASQIGIRALIRPFLTPAAKKELR